MLTALALVILSYTPEVGACYMPNGFCWETDKVVCTWWHGEWEPGTCEN